MNIKGKIRKIPNWPKKGVLFYDLTTLFEDKEALHYMVDELCKPYLGMQIDKIVGIDARGFLLASAMAYQLNAGLSIARKKGKLPYKTIRQDYNLEYAQDSVEMHSDTVKPGEKVVIIDDLIATGGTMQAVAKLVEQLGGVIKGISWVVDLPFLGGSQKFSQYDTHYLVSFENEKIEEVLKIKVGILGGSGLENLDLFQNKKKIKINTPYGPVSDLITLGEINNREIVFLPRHGRNHMIMPSLVNYRANIWAMKKLGVTHLLAPTACGSLKEQIEPGSFVLVDQFIDRTTKREQTFYEGRVCHIAMAEPFCQRLREIVFQTAKELDITCHKQGTIVTIEGPRFSSRAESQLFQSWNADCINMTTVPEVVLAREAGMCYVNIAMVTDYDAWQNSAEAVNVTMIQQTMQRNFENMKKLLTGAIQQINYLECSCREATKEALF